MAHAFDTPITTTDQSVDRVLAAGLPVLLIFLSGPAPQPISQALGKLAKTYAGQMLVVQVQVKDSPITAQRYHVHQTPAVVAVRNQQVQSQADGISTSDIEKHALYLIGQGPKPVTPTASTAGMGGATTPDGAPRPVTDATFDQEVLHSQRPVLVDFWAPWCGPCRMTEPIIEKLARELAGKMNVAKINVDENPGISQRYGIQSIPTMMLVKNGKIVDRWVGALPEGAMRSRITPVVG